MILRPFLYDADRLRELPLRLHRQGAARGRRPPRRPRRRLPGEAERIGAPIVAVLETHVQADHLSGLPALVERDRRDGLPAGGRGGRFRPPRARRRRGRRRSATRWSRRSRRPATPPPIRLPGRRSARAAPTSPGWSSPATRCWSATSGARPARRRRSAPAWRACCMRSLTTAAGAPRPRRRSIPSHYGGSVCGRGLSGNPFSTIGFERRHNRGPAARRRGRLRRGAPAGHAAPAGGPGGDRRRQPLRRVVAARHERPGPARPARERGPVRAARRRSTRSSARWSASSAACCR